MNVSDVVSTIVVASRTQRDISMSLPIGQTNNMGISLNSMLLNHVGYNSSAIGSINRLLDGGLQTWMIDLYYNEATKKWQLCPAPIPQNSSSDPFKSRKVEWKGRLYHCQPSFTVDNLIQQFKQFFLRSNTDVAVNLILVMFNLYNLELTGSSNSTESSKILKNYATFTTYGNSTLNSSLASLGNYLFRPDDIAIQPVGGKVGMSQFYNQSSSKLPLSETFLLTDYKRIIGSVIQNHAPKAAIGPNDKSTLFFDKKNADISYTSDESILENCDTRSLADFNRLSLDTSFRTVIDDDDFRFNSTSFRKYVTCGYSPIMNGSSYPILGHAPTSDISSILSYYSPRSFWSWAPNQPKDRQSLRNSTSFKKREELTSNSQVSHKCVSLQDSGFVLSDCYDEHRFACQKKNSPNEWKVTEQSQSYFSVDNDVCPEGYLFSVPHLSIEAQALRQAIELEEKALPIWVDLNDITVANCFVPGGPYAQCPYQKTVTGRRLVGLIAPSFAVALVILILIFIEKIFRVNPVQTNRKRHWRRAINEYNKQHGYEGVPS